MSNRPEERLLFKRAANKILERYGQWMGENRHLRRILDASDERFDEIIFFLSAPDFMTLMMQKNYVKKTGEGCSVAALTQSNRKDDEMPDYQRRIYYNRAFSGAEHTVVHEIFHLVCHPRFQREMKLQIEEGFTEYFTVKTLGSSDPAKAAAAAASSDKDDKLVSAYGEYLKVGETARAFLKKTVIPMVKENREFLLRMSAPASSAAAAAAAAMPPATPASSSSSSSSSAQRRGGVIMERGELDRALKTEAGKWNAANPAASGPRHGMLSRERDTRNFMADPYEGLSLKDFTKKAYFRGDKVMIKLIKDGVGF